MSMPPTPLLHRRQRGLSLIVTLVLLAIATVLGVSAYRISLGGEKNARNDRDYQLAWQSAEAALLDAQFDMEGPGTAPRQSSFQQGSKTDFVQGCGRRGSPVQGLCLPSDTGVPAWLNLDLSQNSEPVVLFGEFTRRNFNSGATGVQPWDKPRYIIEVLPDGQLFSDKSVSAPKNVVYRVTSLGFGPREGVQTVMQMIFRKE